MMAMLRCPTWFIALDGDKAGDDAAAEWPARAVRVRPPAPDKDWTEAVQSGVNLRRWWSDRLGGIEAPERSTWDELAARRWGPGLTIEGPGFVVDRPRKEGHVSTIEPACLGYDGPTAARRVRVVSESERKRVAARRTIDFEVTFCI